MRYKRIHIPVLVILTLVPFYFVNGAIIDNPLKDITSIPGFIYAVLDLIVMIVTPLIAVFLMYAGFLYVSAAGNEAKIAKAHSVFLWTVIGAAVALGAKIFSFAVQGTIDLLK